jgi:hypothetical protein
MWAGVNQENDALAIEIYPSKSGRPWQFTLAELESVLKQAKEALASS